MMLRNVLVAAAATAIAGIGCADATNPPESPETNDRQAPSFDSSSTVKADQLDETIAPEDCPGGAPKRVDGQPSTWTVVIWSAGDNNLEDALVEDINEMERGHGGSPNVNVLVQLDRKSEDGSWRYEIQPGDDPDQIESELVGHSDEELDSGNWKNYAAFGQWATVCYPAERYMTVIEGHGGGWSPPSDQTDDDEDDDRSERTRREGDPARLIAPDDTDDTEMSIQDLKHALDHIRAATRQDGDPSWVNRLSIYGSDACLMQTVEVLHSLNDTARYIVGSAENEPGPGWPYYTVLDDLTTRPTHYAQTPHRLTETIVSNYGKSYGSRGGQGDRTNYTLAAVDTRRIDSMVDSFGDVSELLVALLDEVEPHLDDARDEAILYGDSIFSTGVYVDVGTLLTELRARLIEANLAPADGEHWDGDERWRELRNAIDDLMVEFERRAITHVTLGPDLTDSDLQISGLSVFAPESANSWRLEFSSYAESAFAAETRWDEIVEQTFID